MWDYFFQQILRKKNFNPIQYTDVSSGNCYELIRDCFQKKLWTAFLIEENGKIYTFASIELKSAQFARLFRDLNLKRSDRICVEAKKCYEVVCLYIACLRYGAIFVPINPRSSREETEYIIGNAKPSLIICRDDNESVFHEIIRVEGINIPVLTLGKNGGLTRKSRYAWPDVEITKMDHDDIACILYTSGTTGPPKGVALSHKNIALGTQTLSKVWQFTQADILLHALSLAHGYGLMTFNIGLYSGSKILLLQSTSIDRIAHFLQYVTVFMGTPLWYKRLSLSKKIDPISVRGTRLFVSGSAPLSKKTYDDFMQRTGKKIIDRYGMTETIVNTSNEIDNEHPGSCGKPIPCVELRIKHSNGQTVSPGEIGNVEIRSPYLFKEYWNDHRKTEEVFRHDGFFITGDMGSVDKEGFVWLAGRSNEIIYSNEGLIYPAEIERHIEDIEGVEASAAFGIPHPQFPIFLIAIVQLQRNQVNLTQEKILTKLKKILDSHKIPKKILFIDSLPRNTSGKIQKSVLYEKYKSFFLQGAL